MQTWTIPPNSLINEDTGSYKFVHDSNWLLNKKSDLTPFWNGPSTFWKSSDRPIKDWTGFNYEYPDFVPLRGQSEEQRRKAILCRVGELYGPTYTSSTSVAPSAPRTSNIERADIVDWFVRIHSGRFALGGSYNVLLFLGEPPASEAEWLKSSALLGIHTVFTSSRASMCANCHSQINNVDEGFVHITERLESLGLLKKPEGEIEKYIRDNLHFFLMMYLFRGRGAKESYM